MTLKHDLLRGSALAALVYAARPAPTCWPSETHGAVEHRLTSECIRRAVRAISAMCDSPSRPWFRLDHAL